jgi:hypothetical protein
MCVRLMRLREGMHRRCLLRAAGIAMRHLLFIASKLRLRLRLKRYLGHEKLDRRILHSLLENNQDSATGRGQNFPLY